LPDGFAPHGGPTVTNTKCQPITIPPLTTIHHLPWKPVATPLSVSLILTFAPASGTTLGLHHADAPPTASTKQTSRRKRTALGLHHPSECRVIKPASSQQHRAPLLLSQQRRAPASNSASPSPLTCALCQFAAAIVVFYS
ncbi:hypothetical protein PIB30_064942, partial [Stylosanthes scabra]|nr:hypothetical protein [Stylosanthes scabra]